MSEEGIALNSTPSVTKSRGCCHSTRWPRRGLKCVTTKATGRRAATRLRKLGLPSGLSSEDAHIAVRQGRMVTGPLVNWAPVVP